MTDHRDPSSMGAMRSTDGIDVCDDNAYNGDVIQSTMVQE